MTKLVTGSTMRSVGTARVLALVNGHALTDVAALADDGGSGVVRASKLMPWSLSSRTPRASHYRPPIPHWSRSV
jgi:hypothetical protein